MSTASGRTYDEGPANPFPKNLDAWSAAWDDPREFSRQIAVYHQQCLDEGFQPHVDYRGTMTGCAPCATV